MGFLPLTGLFFWTPHLSLLDAATMGIAIAFLHCQLGRWMINTLPKGRMLTVLEELVVVLPNTRVEEIQECQIFGAGVSSQEWCYQTGITLTLISSK
jgi:hypothetical protein